MSKTTISRVLNNKPDVDPATRERILLIIDEQSFIPSIPAAGLASGRRQLIGMLIPSFTWPLIPELMRGVAEVLEQTSYELVLYSINDTDLRRDRSEVINRVLATQLKPAPPPDTLAGALKTCRLFVDHPIARMTGLCALIRRATPE